MKAKELPSVYADTLRGVPVVPVAGAFGHKCVLAFVVPEELHVSGVFKFFDIRLGGIGADVYVDRVCGRSCARADKFD